MLASVRRLERTGLRICKDISSSCVAVDCLISKIASQQERITKCRADLLRVINSIALRVQMSGSGENAQASLLSEAETRLPYLTSWLHQLDAMPLMPGKMRTPVSTTSLDIPSCGTTYDLLSPWRDPILPSNGSGDPLELENLDSPMRDFLQDLLRSPERSGGQATCLNETSSLTTSDPKGSTSTTCSDGLIDTDVL